MRWTWALRPTPVFGLLELARLAAPVRAARDIGRAAAQAETGLHALLPGAIMRAAHHLASGSHDASAWHTDGHTVPNHAGTACVEHSAIALAIVSTAPQPGTTFAWGPLAMRGTRDAAPGQHTTEPGVLYLASGLVYHRGPPDRAPGLPSCDPLDNVVYRPQYIGDTNALGALVDIGVPTPDARFLLRWHVNLREPPRGTRLTTAVEGAE